MKAYLEYLRRFFTTFDFETGKTEEPTIDTSILDITDASHRVEVASARKANDKIAERNEATFKGSPILDRAMYKTPTADSAKLKQGVITAANRITAIDTISGTATSLKEPGLSDKGREKLIAATVRDVQKLVPQMNEDSIKKLIDVRVAARV